MSKLSTYVAAVINSSVAASKWHLGLFNGASSNRRVVVWRAEVTSHLTAANTGTSSSFLLRRISAAGTGTAAAIRKHNSKDAGINGQITALHTYTVNPTSVTDGEMAEITINTEEANAQTAKLPIFQADPARGIEPIELLPGEGLAVQQSGLASDGAVSCFVWFTVESTRGTAR